MQKINLRIWQRKCFLSLKNDKSPNCRHENVAINALNGGFSLTKTGKTSINIFVGILKITSNITYKNPEEEFYHEQSRISISSS